MIIYLGLTNVNEDAPVWGFLTSVDKACKIIHVLIVTVVLELLNYGDCEKENSVN